MLAEKEQYIAEFYFKRDMYDSAQRRYEKLLDLYPQIESIQASALYGAATSAFQNGDREKGAIHGKKLMEKYPSSYEASAIRKEFGQNGL